MKISHLRLLISCHGWEDFPTHLTGDEAENLLANWSALWHPVLIAASGAVPVWHRVDSPPEDCAEYLFVCPQVSVQRLPVGFEQRVGEQNGIILQPVGTREAIANDCLAKAGLSNLVPPERTDFFFALGYIYLQVQILTRQYRYSSSLDHTQFERLLLRAAQAAVDGSEQQLQQELMGCFDLLSEERNRYFANEIMLIDWTLASENQIKRVPGQVELKRQNVLVDRTSLSILEQNQDLRDLIQQGIDDKQVCIVGGEASELNSNLLSFTSLVHLFSKGRQKFLNTLGQSATVFARQKFGINPSYPQILKQSGFVGALHSTMDDGRFPTHPDNVISWSGFGNESIPTLAESPLDATLAETFLQLSGKISQAIDRRHQAVISFVHWAGQYSPWYRDLMIATQFGQTLGRFVLLTEFFESDFETNSKQRWVADDYQSPCHKQAIVRGDSNPVSRWCDYWKAVTELRAAAALQAMSAPYVVHSDETSQSTDNPGLATFLSHSQMSDLHSEIAAATDGRNSQALSDKSEPLLQHAVATFTKLICTREFPAGGTLIVNPHSVSRRQWFCLDAQGIHCDQDQVIYCQEKTDRGLQAVVDVPAMGFVFLKHQDRVPSAARVLSLVDGQVLRNEFFQITSDPNTGGIRSVMLYNERGNLLSQQIAFRKADQRRSRGRDDVVYSQMQRESWEFVEENRVRATMVSRGQLICEEQRVAEFVQTVTVIRGIRVFDIRMDLTPLTTVRPNPWVEYFSARFAWSNEAAPLRRAINEHHDQVTSSRIESPLYLEIDSGPHTTTLFTGGMPYHRRDGYRTLDCLLIPAAESQTSFCMGIGVDVKSPLHEAFARLTPMSATYSQAAPHNPSGWVFHFNRRNVIPIEWSVEMTASNGKRIEIWLKETEGRECQLKVTCPMAPQRATVIDLIGNQSDVVEIVKDQVILPMERFGFRRVILDW